MMDFCLSMSEVKKIKKEIKYMKKLRFIENVWPDPLQGYSEPTTKR